MKTLFNKYASARRLGILLGGGVALMLMHGAAMAGIATTKHNLGSGGTGSNHAGPTGATAEICVFCHTPHGSDTSASVPLWNRKLSAPGAYTSYSALGTSSLDGATAPVGSVSIACLSCHDGTQAMNVVINAPGSGGYVAAGSAAWDTSTWVGTKQLNGATITNIGVDLQNDHPVGIQYAGGGYLSSANLNVTNVAATGTKKDADFVTPTVTGNASTANFWIDTGTAGRQKTDLILYTRTEATVGNVAQPFVECASCHDPHTDAQATFLRTSNANSALCLACHTK